jgi:hypothetical protein
MTIAAIYNRAAKSFSKRTRTGVAGASAADTGPAAEGVSGVNHLPSFAPSRDAFSFHWPMMQNGVDPTSRVIHP